MAELSLIRQIDVCLGRYYHKLGVKTYFVQSKGKFQIWCDENGFEDGDVSTALLDDPNDCTMTEFDPNFPFKKQPPNTDEAIFSILKRCSQNPDEFKDNMMLYPVFTPTKDHWGLTEKELSHIINIYKRQLPNICDKAMGEDKSLMKLLAIGYKENVSYLSFLADCFLRDQLTYRIQSNTSDTLHIHEWARISTHFNKLLNLNNTHNSAAFDEAQAAIQSYFKRICPALIPKELFTIDDSLDDICSYIMQIVDFVYTLSRKQEAHCPFQVDNCFIFHSVSNKKENMVSMAPNNDSDDDDDDDIDNEMVSDEKKNDSWKYIDRVKDIKDKLKHNGIPYLSNSEIEAEPLGNASISTLSVDQSHMSNAGAASRIKHQFNQFKQFKVNHKYKGDELYQYPRNKRIVVVVDRREPLDDKSKKYITEQDEIIIFEPPENCSTIPHDLNIKHVPEWFMESSKTCIIPNIGYIKKMKQEQKVREKHLNMTDDDYKKAENEAENIGNNRTEINNKNNNKSESDASKPWKCPKCDVMNDSKSDKCSKCEFNEKENILITSSTGCSSGVIILSFHVESCDEIKCYLYWQGAFIRFFPQDIKTLLPTMFNMEINGNKDFCASQEANDLVKYLLPKMRDYPFESFYKEYKLKKHQIQLEQQRRQKLKSSTSLPNDSNIKSGNKIENNYEKKMENINIDDEKGLNISFRNLDTSRKDLTISKSEPTININEDGPYKLINWLSLQNSAKSYVFHWNVFKQKLLENYNDDDELDMDTLIEDFEDEDNCEYINALKNNQNCKGTYTQYIQELILELKDYKMIIGVK